MTKRKPEKRIKFVRPGCRTEQMYLSAPHLIADFLFLQKKLGRRPSINEYLYHCHTPKVLDRVFGKSGWKRLIKAVGKRALPKDKVNKEHLIQDYLDTAHAVGHQPSHSDFYERHRHSINVFVRVFGKPGWKKLRKAAAFVKRKPGACAEFACTRAAVPGTRRVKAHLLPNGGKRYIALRKRPR